MPPTARKPAAKPDEEKPARKDGDICSRCWPNGWPNDATNGASCAHGNYKR